MGAFQDEVHWRSGAKGGRVKGARARTRYRGLGDADRELGCGQAGVDLAEVLRRIKKGPKEGFLTQKAHRKRFVFCLARGGPGGDSGMPSSFGPAILQRTEDPLRPRAAGNRLGMDIADVLRHN